MKDIRNFGGLFMLAAVAFQGIPLDGDLSISTNPAFDAARERVLLRTTGHNDGGGGLKTLLWLLLYAGSFFLLVFRLPQSTKILVTRNLYLVAMIMLVPLSVIWSSNVDIVLTTSAHVIGTFAIAAVAAISYKDSPTVLLRHLSYVLGANLFVHLASVIIVPEYAINWEGRWRGLFKHPNNLGAVAFCALAINAAVWTVTRRPNRWVHLVSISLAVIALFGSQSKTSTLCALIAGGGAIFLAGIYRNYGRKIAWQIALLSSLIATLVALPVIFYSQELLEILTGIVGRDMSFTGRTDIWSAAISAICERPLTGWSFDGHLEIISRTLFPYTNYHNGYLDVMVSGGIGALVLFGLLIGHFGLRLKRAEPTHIVIFLPVAVSILVHNVFEAGLLTGRGIIWLTLILIVLLQSEATFATTAGKRKSLWRGVS